ncbi:Toll/interleukin-1 receptor domain-containing protein, partial [Tanacetum coccineum]
GQIVMPVFYDVDPSDVRKQRGDFGEAFSKQVEENTTKAELWRKELVAASNISGWEPKNIDSGIGLDQKILRSRSIRSYFARTANIDEGLVGMRARLQDLISQHEIGSGGVRMVGIWGLGGGGKTTLAISVYMEILRHFKSHCIIENIRKRKIKSMLCHSNVLVILDDVDDLDQLEALAGSPNWFGDGSRIIITTRDEHLLRKHKVDHVSPVRLLADDEAIELFRTLKVLGSFLYDKEAKEWMSTLDRLRDIPESEIVDKLKISYDGLKPVEKELFLDIACFFRGKLKGNTMEIFDVCGFHPEIGIKHLPQLKVLQLRNVERLVSTPDFKGLPRLQKLELEGCGELEEIHSSLGNHRSVKHVYVSFCYKLRMFPTIVRMEQLESLHMSDCHESLVFPEIQANMECLVELYMCMPFR